MGNFQIPVKQVIINDTAQLELYGDVGAGPVLIPEIAGTPAHFLDPSDPSHKLSLRGKVDWFLAEALVLLEAAERIKKSGADLGQRQRVDYTVQLPVGVTAPKGTVVRVVTWSYDLENTAYQNKPLEKRYTLSKDCDTADEIADDIVAIINADTVRPVHVTASGTPGVFSVFDLSTTHSSEVFVGIPYAADTPLFTFADSIIVERKNGYNTYEQLKNLQWSKGVEVDRTAEYYPIHGAMYNSYYFNVESDTLAIGGFDVPSEVPETTVTEFVFYVNQSLTGLVKQFDQLVFDMNV